MFVSDVGVSRQVSEARKPIPPVPVVAFYILIVAHVPMAPSVCSADVCVFEPDFAAVSVLLSQTGVSFEGFEA